MSREKDSEIIYGLVTSKYKIAERNRLAKLNFLSQMKKNEDTKAPTTTVTRRDSEPSLADKNAKKVEIKKFDLSVPGTPVSSRYLDSLNPNRRRNKNHTTIDTDSENEDFDHPMNYEPSEMAMLLEENLKKFTHEMDKMHKDDDPSSHDPLKKYFEESDHKRSYRRDFSEVFSEFPIHGQKQEQRGAVKKAENYFTESERLNSFKREFNDVFRSFDPKNPTGREQFVDLNRVGTPISSRLIATHKLSDSIGNDIKITHQTTPAASAPVVALHSDKIDGNSQVVVVEKSKDDVNGTLEFENKLKISEDAAALLLASEENESQIDSKKTFSTSLLGRNGAESSNELIIIDDEEDDDEVKKTKVNEEGSWKFENESQTMSKGKVDDDDVGRSLSLNEAMASERVESIQPKQRLKRSDSAASDISIPGTPVSSRHLPSLVHHARYISDTDDSGSEGVTTSENMEITAMAKEFVNEIESLVQKSFDDDDKQEIAMKKLTTTESSIHKQEDDDDVEVKLSVEGGEQEKKVGKVDEYFQTSQKDKSYARTFSQVEDFNRAPHIPAKAVKDRVDWYFQESQRRGSLKRPFSQAVEYFPSKYDVKPGTPVSSVGMNIKTRRSDEEKENVEDPEVLKGQEILRKAQEAIEAVQQKFPVNEYFDESKNRQTYQRNFSEVQSEYNKQRSNSAVDASKNAAEIEKYFQQSDAQKSFQRTFSEAVQEVEPSLNEILKVDEKREKPFHYQRSSRASSISSNCSDLSDIDNPLSARKHNKKHGKKYGIDKYFATSLYRTAYHRSRSSSRRQSTETEEAHIAPFSLKIVEDEDVFGETELLSRNEFQHDDETRVTHGPNEVNGNQTVEFWRDFLKPYNLNLQSEIKITKDDLMNNRTLE